MSDLHLSAEELQTFAEGLLPDPDRVVVESHLVTCTRCQHEVEEWRSLFLSLSALPQFEPSAGFANRVIARLQSSHATSVVPSSAAAWHVRTARQVGRQIARYAPKTTRGWALATAFLALPVVTIGLALTWLLSSPYITVRTLWAFASDRGAHAMQSLGAGTISWVMKTDAAAWIVRASGQLVHQVGLSGVGALAAGVALATTVSAWVLYKNLFRSPSRETNYVSFSF